MAKETKNLKLHQVTRPEDDSKAFNLETMLNENWEKLDSAVGDLSQPVTAAEGSAIGLRVQNGRLQYKNNESWTELGLEYEDVKNLAARPNGLVTWTLPQSTDNTRTAIVLCRASKDITNLGYAACLSDASITKNTLAQNATSNTYSGLVPSTQYWVKAFVKYALGGKEFYSGGVAVTFTTPAFQEITNLTVNPTTELVTWTLPNGSTHTNVEVCYSKTNINGYTYAQCQADSNVTKAELSSNATSYTVNVLDKATYYVKVFLKYSSGYSNGVVANWQNPKQWYYKSGNENVAVTGGIVVGYSKEAGHQSKQNGYLTIYAGWSNIVSARSYETNNTINLTGIKKIKALVDIICVVSPCWCDFSVATKKAQIPWEGVAYARLANEDKQGAIMELNVSAIEGLHYIAISSMSTKSTTDVKVYQIWGE